MLKSKKIPYFNPLMKKLDELCMEELLAVSRQAFESYSNEYKRQKGNRDQKDVPKLNNDFLQLTLPLVLHESSMRLNKSANRRSIFLGLLSIVISLSSIYISIKASDEASKISLDVRSLTEKAVRYSEDDLKFDKNWKGEQLKLLTKLNESINALNVKLSKKEIKVEKNKNDAKQDN